jgi:serine/threonine protein phosphatase PrpC
MIGTGLTHCGKIREINEDSFHLSTSHHLYGYAIVADGMGGHQAGEIASQMAVQIVSDFIEQQLQQESVDTQEILYEAIELANQKIYDFALRQQSMLGMGTTIVTAITTNDKFYVAHVGDSRLYLIRNHQITQITEDHSHVQTLVNQGIISADEARFHSKRNIILRALGTEPTVQIDVSFLEWFPEDLLLVCSDGLSNMLTDQRIVEIIAHSDSYELAVKNLIDAANDAGGDDNITAVILCNE